VITVVLANGPEDKWGGYLGVPRHFIEIDGERLIDRTVRQFAPSGPVIVSGPDERYAVEGASWYRPEPEPEHLDADILLSTRDLWSRRERTVLALGDTWFSDAAVVAITSHAPMEWTYFGRKDGSRYSETDYGELFALSFWPPNIAGGLSAMLDVLERQRHGLWRGGLWEHYRVMQGIDPLVHEIRDGFVEIDDETDDFDFPAQYETWLRNYHRMAV